MPLEKHDLIHELPEYKERIHDTEDDEQALRHPVREVP